MIVLLNLYTGESLNFKTRNEAAEFLKVSLPTLRKWLDRPFYLHENYIITLTNHERAKKTKEKLIIQRIS
jgi:predicted phage tail protein